MDMKELLKSVDALADIEFSRAMEIYPAFHSDHEGVAVVEEEIWETKCNE